VFLEQIKWILLLRNKVLLRSEDTEWDGSILLIQFDRVLAKTGGHDTSVEVVSQPLTYYVAHRRGEIQ
jgi:hypothetical protein